MTEIAADSAPKDQAICDLLKKLSPWMLAIAVLVVGCLAATFMVLALPANDDFERAVRPIQHIPSGWWDYCSHLYMTWQGRWAAYGLEAGVLPVSNMTVTYPALLATVAVVNLIGCYVVCRFFTPLASRWFSLACALGLAALLWSSMPSVAEAVYWFVGTVENAMTLSLAGMLIVGLISLRPTYPWTVFAAISAIIICGLHEAYGAMLCMVLAAGTVAAHLLKSEKRNIWLVTLIAAVVGIGIVVAAPGNAIRMKKDSGLHSKHLVYDLKVMLSQIRHWWRVWLLNPKLIAASLWVACSPGLEKSRPVWDRAGRWPFRFLVPAVWLAMLVLGFFAPSWAFGTNMPARTLSANYIVFAVGWLVIVFLWTRNVDARESIAIRFPFASSTCAAVGQIVLAITLLCTGNGLAAIRDLASHRATTWRANVEKRYALMLKNPGTDLIVPPQGKASLLLYPNGYAQTGDISSTFNDSDWINKSLAEYFHLKSVRVPPLATTGPATAPAVEAGPAESAAP